MPHYIIKSDSRNKRKPKTAESSRMKLDEQKCLTARKNNGNSNQTCIQIHCQAKRLLQQQTDRVGECRSLRNNGENIVSQPAHYIDIVSQNVHYINPINIVVIVTGRYWRQMFFVPFSCKRKS